MKSIIAKIFATSFGAGFMPIAPGTFGALFAALCSVLIMHNQDLKERSDFIHLSLVILSYSIGVFCVKLLQNEWGDDPSKIVIDESCGYWISLLFLPLNYTVIILAFIFFRIFDIWKPLFIRRIDQIKNAQSVMLDDVLAGVYANIMIRLVFLIIGTDKIGCY